MSTGVVLGDETVVIIGFVDGSGFVVDPSVNKFSVFFFSVVVSGILVEDMVDETPFVVGREVVVLAVDDDTDEVDP